MNLDTLKVFCDVVRCQSFSRGAAMNRISQSAASQAVHQLERHFGVQLIDRSKRPFLLTPEGRACYDGMWEVLERYNAADARIRSLREEVNGTVRVASIYSVGLHHMGRCMQEFMTRYPKAMVRLEYLRPDKVYEAVLDETVDLGIVSYPTASRGLSVIPLRSENMVVVCPPGHPLTDLKRVTLARLDGESFIGFERDLPIRKELDRCLRQKEVSVNVVMAFDNIETIKQAIEIGSGIGILPEPTVRKEALAGTLAAIPLAVRELRRPIGLIHRQRKIFTPAILKFVELLKAVQENNGEEE